MCLLERTCRIASLCISPVQAGIMLFSTANSSFILDLRRRSIKLWAVFLAILRPATLVADGCFFLDEQEASLETGTAAAAGGAAGAAVDFRLAVVGPPFPAGPAAASSGGLRASCVRGFIWMILRDRVGGGGSANESLGVWAEGLADGAGADRFRDLTTSLGWIG